MQIINKLSDMIEEEMDDAEKYIECAMKYKDELPALSAVFYKLSMEEMVHMSMLHDQVTALISDYRREHGDPPADMQGIYDYLHKRHTQHANKIKVMQGLYK